MKRSEKLTAINSLTLRPYSKPLSMAGIQKRETELTQTNRCISDHIDLSGRTLEVIVPDDNSIKYSIILYDENKQYVSETGYVTYTQA